MEIGAKAAYKVTLEGKGEWSYEFECIETGATKYGNGTAVTLDVIDAGTGEVVNESLFDTRYVGVPFNVWVNDYMAWNINPAAHYERTR